MPYNLLLLPLLGGYFFITSFTYLKYKYKRLPSQRVLFASIISGTLLIFIMFGVRSVVDYFSPETITKVSNGLYELPIHRVNYMWTCIIAFLFAFIGTHILNLFLAITKYLWFKKPMVWAVERYGNELEQLFMDSAIQAKAIQVTLKSRKVYIGLSVGIPKPGETNYLKLTPLVSGYRKRNTMELEFVTDYFKALNWLEGKYYGQPLFDYDITLKQDEILTATFYNPELQASLEEISSNGKKKKRKKKKESNATGSENSDDHK